LKVVGLGAGGHAKVVIDVLSRASGIDLVGLLSPDPAIKGQKVAGLRVLGGDELLGGLREQGVNGFVVCVGGTRNTAARQRLFELAVRHGLEPVPAIHERAIIARSARFGRGPTVLAGAIINPDAVVGDNVLINTGAIIEHDVQLGNHVHVGPGARIAGGVVIETGAYVGIGATIRQGQRIGAAAVVGAGAVVVDDVAPGATVVGVPARIRPVC
jgi:UDP-perosamine 4-acetyltransferase